MAIVDSRLRPRCATRDVYLLIFIVEQDLVGIDAAVSAISRSPLRNTYDAPYSTLCKNMTSSTKPEVHNITTPSEEDQATTTGSMHKKLVWFGRVVSEICEWTDRQTDRHTDYNTSYPSPERSNKLCLGSRRIICLLSRAQQMVYTFTKITRRRIHELRQQWRNQ